jgi:predicted RNA binding protein YcfA (HicA-like mRNA interferase family)
VKSLSGKEFARMLKSHGWLLQRINGSHHIYTKAGTTVRISVPIHGSSMLKTGLQRLIAERMLPTHALRGGRAVPSGQLKLSALYRAIRPVRTA